MKKYINLICLLFFTFLIITTKGQYEDSYEIVYYDYDFYYDEDELLILCRTYAKNAFYPSPKGINFYLYCADEITSSYEAKCPDDSPIFEDGFCDALPTTSITPLTPTKPITENIKTTSTIKKRITYTTIQTETPPTKSNKTSFKTTTNKRIIPTISTAEKCPNIDDPHHLVFIPSTTICSQYYVCYHGNALLMSCEDKLHFNQNTKKCDFPERARCKIEESRGLIAKCRSTSKIEYYNHPEKCNYFYYCTQGILSLQQCPHMHSWDLKTRRCIRQHLSDCVE